MRWLIIGTGNVAWHLIQSLTDAGETCVGVVSRDLSKAQTFASLTPTLLAYSFDTLQRAPPQIDVCILAVADDVLVNVSSKITFITPCIALHTSGTKSLESLNILGNMGWKTGVWYPLQTLSKHKEVAWQQVPLLLEMADLPTLQALENIARRISGTVIVASSEQRRWLHVVAVMTANFMHHLCTIGDKILTEKHLSLSLLAPLLQETLEKALLAHPEQTQTGPARRGDMQTIENHISLLQDFPAWQQVYKVLTNSILSMYPKTI